MSATSPQRCFEQIKGFGSYGFPESHAASFAQLVYISAWIKCHHPGGLRLRAAQFAADGLLCAGADRARRAGAWRRGPRRRCQLQRLGQHAGADRREAARPAARLSPDRRRPRSGGAAPRRTARRRLCLPSRTSRPARGCQPERCAPSPMPMPFARSASTGARRSGRCAACRTMIRCRSLPPRRRASWPTRPTPTCRACRFASMSQPTTRPCACR